MRRGRSGALYAQELRRREVRAGRTWYLDEAATRVGGRLHWLWRAVDEHGRTLDVIVQAHRDTGAAERFFRRLLRATGGVAPARITTDRLGSYSPAAVQRFLDAFSRVGTCSARGAIASRRLCTAPPDVMGVSSERHGSRGPPWRC